MWEIVTDHYQQLLFMVVLLACSGLFSGSETALFSLSVSEINRFRRSGGSLADTILALHQDRSNVLLTILFCNMIVNILFFANATVLTTYLVDRYGSGGGFAFSLLSLALVIVCGEVAPKSLAALAQTAFCRLSAVPLYLLHRALWPVMRALRSILRMIERLANVVPTSASVREDELKLLVEMSRQEGLITSHEHNLLNAVIDLPDVRIGECLTPRLDMKTIALDAPAQKAVEYARTTGHSKIPVRDPQSDECIGWVDAREIFLSKEDHPARHWLQEALTLSEFDRADQALEAFLRTRKRLGLVVDERGATIGMLTVSDILGEIFGDITDEEATAREAIRNEGPGTYRLDGHLSVREWRNLFGFAHELPRVATLGGLVVALLGRTPQAGDIVRLRNLQMEVTRIHKRRIREIRLTLLDREGHA